MWRANDADDSFQSAAQNREELLQMNKARIYFAAAVAAVFAATGSSGVSAQSKVSGTFSIVTLPPGTTYNATAAGIAKLFNEHSGARMRLREAPTQLEQLVASGEAEFGLGAGPTSYDCYAGLALYAGKPCKNLRMIMVGPTLFGGFFAATSSGMTKVSDLKGKRVPGKFPGSAAFLDDTTVALAADGLSWEDVKVLPVAGIRENYQAFMDGQVDAANASVGSGIINQADAKFRGVRFLTLPPPGPAVNAAMDSAKLGYFPVTLKTGAFTGILQDTTVWAKDIVLNTNPEAPSDAVYALTKILWERVRELDSMHSAMKTWTHEVMTSDRIIAPMHEGAVRFFKEAGKWSPQLEARNNKLIALHGK
jgi:TRAP transporter TAXI family solute receptor